MLEVATAILFPTEKEVADLLDELLNPVRKSIHDNSFYMYSSRGRLIVNTEHV